MYGNLKRLGILGGMGPAATVDFLAKVIAATPAVRDQDHIPMIISNVPQIPDRSAAILSGSDAPLSALTTGVAMLEAAGADILAMPCNTAHFWYDALERRARRPLLHIVDAVRRRVTQQDRVGLLATKGTLQGRVYQARLGADHRLIVPDDAGQGAVDAAIRELKEGRRNTRSCEGVIDALLSAGAQTIILGCTELPIVLRNSPLLKFCLDPTQALAEDCVAAARGNLEAHAV